MTIISPILHCSIMCPRCSANILTIDFHCQWSSFSLCRPFHRHCETPVVAIFHPTQTHIYTVNSVVATHFVRHASLFNVLSYGAVSTPSVSMFQRDALPPHSISIFLLAFEQHKKWYVQKFCQSFQNFRRIHYFSQWRMNGTIVCASVAIVGRAFICSLDMIFFPPISIRPFFLFAVAIAVDFYFECELWVVTICTCNVFTSDGQPHLCMGCDVCVCSRETRELQSNRINEKCKSNIC